MKKSILKRMLILLVAPLLFAGALGCWETPFSDTAADYPTFEYDAGGSSNFKLSVGFMPRVEFLDQMVDKEVISFDEQLDYDQDVCDLILSNDDASTFERISNGQCESFFANATDYDQTSDITEMVSKFNVPKQRIIDCKQGITDVCIVQMESHASFNYRHFGVDKYDDATYTSPTISELDLRDVTIIPGTCSASEVWDESSLECLPTTPLGVCGDGALDSGEACDDGNVTSGDGCSDICELETPCDDYDNDGICNMADDDNDNDGWSDIEEDECMSDPLDANDEPLDDDGDGVCNILDDDQSLSQSSGDDASSSADASASEFGGGSCSLNPAANADFNSLFLLALLCLTTPVAITLHIRKKR